jgi:vacuolar-type H+-ATPase subunit H
LPLTRNAIIDRDAALNLIDELRVAVPEEVRAAKRINQEGERIIEKAQEEAERIVGRAQEQAAYLIEERGLTEAAEDQSRRILAGADEEAGAVRAGADDNATGVLSDLRSEVARTLSGIERGIAMLDERRAAYLQAQPHEPEPGAGVDDDGYEAEAYHEDLDEEEGASTVSRR